MAKRKKPSGPFQTEGMTVEQILNLDYSIINNMNKRDLSHALKTVALAANKRVSRLKANQADIAEDALNWLADQGYKRKKFGSKNKTLNQMRNEMTTLRQFMDMKTSTVRGAISVRQVREKRIMGETREQAVKRGRYAFVSRYMQEHAGRAPKMADIKKEMKRLEAEYMQMNSDAWAIYRQMLEAQGWPNSPYKNYYGSSEIIEMIGNRVAAGDDDEDILVSAIDQFNDFYESEEEAIIDDDDGLDIPGDYIYT